MSPAGRAVDRDEHHGLAIFSLRVGSGRSGVEGDAERAHHVLISERDRAALDASGDALARSPT